MQMSAQSTWQMKVLALNDSTNVICTVSTVCAPACDSSIHFYTDDWKPLTTSLFITLPLMDDFLNAPDSAGVYEFDEARRSADMLLMCFGANEVMFRIFDFIISISVDIICQEPYTLHVWE